MNDKEPRQSDSTPSRDVPSEEQDDERAEGQGQAEEESEDSFPASDPPSW